MIPVQLAEHGPITEMDETLLERKDTFLENDHERTAAIEYWLGQRCVHRSVHVHLKQGLSLTAEQGAFGG
jgi:hypothetical protein